MARGQFITFEGIEGCGKSTQCTLAAEALRARGLSVLVTREPGGTAIGDRIRTILLDRDCGEMHPLTEALLYAASRAQHVRELIAPALARGTIVLCDRFADSSLVYQGAGRAIPDTIIAPLQSWAVEQTRPAATFIFDLPVSTGLSRVQTRPAAADRIEQETLTFHERVRAGYLTLAQREPERVQVVDATPSIETIHRVVMQRIDRLVTESA